MRIKRGKSMYAIIWEYQAKAERVAEFESIYRSNGAWAKLFRKGQGYLGTELLRDADHPRRYVTIDSWTSSEAYASFLAQWKQEYDALDSHCSDLARHESLLGAFTSV